MPDRPVPFPHGFPLQHRLSALFPDAVRRLFHPSLTGFEFEIEFLYIQAKIVSAFTGEKCARKLPEPSEEGGICGRALYGTGAAIEGGRRLLSIRRRATFSEGLNGLQAKPAILT
jgi:hypothetical protein